MLNVKICAGSGSNTGFGDCPVDLKNIVGFILTPKGFAISAANSATKELALAALQDAIIATSSNRIYPVNNIAATDGNIEDPVSETLGYGAIVTIRDGNYNVNLRFLEGGLCLSNALRKFNSKRPEVLFIDANGVLFGQRVGGELRSVPLLNFYQRPFSLNDGSGAVAGYITNMVFEPRFINENIGFIDGEGSTFWQLEGLQDVVISETTGSAEPILKIIASTGCSGDDFITEFATELATIGNWSAKNAATGADITITSVAVSGSVATVTLSAVDTDYPTSGGSVKLSLAAPSVLDAAGIVGFESNTITVAVTP